MLCEEEVSGECVDDFAVSNIMKERDVTNEKKSDGDDDLDEDARSIMTALEEYSEKNVRFLYELVQSGTIRDYDELFLLPAFYCQLVEFTKKCWMHFDRYCLRKLKSRKHTNNIPFEDELIEISDPELEMLFMVYEILARLLSLQEFQPEMAERHRAFDSSFICLLVSRFGSWREVQEQPESSDIMTSNYGAYASNICDVSTAGTLRKESKMASPISITKGTPGARIPGRQQKDPHPGVMGGLLQHAGNGLYTITTMMPGRPTVSTFRSSFSMASSSSPPSSEESRPSTRIYCPPSCKELALLRALLYAVYKCRAIQPKQEEQSQLHLSRKVGLTSSSFSPSSSASLSNLLPSSLRRNIRHEISMFFRLYTQHGDDPTGVAELLAIVGAIIKGAETPLKRSHVNFLFSHVMPLHKVSGKLSNDMSSTLSVYHEQLVYVLFQYLDKMKPRKDAEVTHKRLEPVSSLLSSSSSSVVPLPAPALPLVFAVPSRFTTLKDIITMLLSSWPGTQDANSPKELLLLNELEKLMEFMVFMDTKSILDLLPPIFQVISAGIQSQNHLLAQRALRMWQNELFVSITSCNIHTLVHGKGSYGPGNMYATADNVHRVFQHIVGTVFQALMSEKHWNSSVNKMRKVVINIFLESVPQELMNRILLDHWRKAIPPHLIGSAPNRTSESSDASVRWCKEQLEEWLFQLSPPEKEDEDDERSRLLRRLRTQSVIPDRLDAHRPLTAMDLVFGQILGEGSFAQVRYAKVINRVLPPSKWQEVAVKIIDPELVRRQGPECAEQVEREIRIMDGFSSPFISRLLAQFSTVSRLYLVTEYAEKGDLHSLVTKVGSLAMESAAFFAAEVLLGLEHVHSKGVVYGDLKPENVLVHGSGHIKLTDFGAARTVEEVKRAREVEGTADYLAPEVVKGGGSFAGFAADLWAYGCLVYFLLAGRPPLWMSEGLGAEEGDERDGRAAAQVSEDYVMGTDDEIIACAVAPSFVKNSPPKKKKRRNRKDSSHPFGEDASLGSSTVDIFQKVVRFNIATNKFPADFPPNARDLIVALLQADPADRLGMITKDAEQKVDYSIIQEHPFFANFYTSGSRSSQETVASSANPSPLDAGSTPVIAERSLIPFSMIHTVAPPPMNVGSTIPALDSQWARRKGSIIRAPMPQHYTFDSPHISMTALPEHREDNGEWQMMSGSSSGAPLPMPASSRVSSRSSNPFSSSSSSLPVRKSRFSPTNPLMALSESKDDNAATSAFTRPIGSGIPLKGRLMPSSSSRVKNIMGALND